MREMIILHCRVVYQSNVLLGQWTDYGFYGVVGREEGGGINPGELKKKIRRNISEPPIFTSFLFLIKKWITFRCASSTRRYKYCKYEKEAQDAQQFQSLFLLWVM